MIEDGAASPGHPRTAADILEARSGEILSDYEGRLAAVESPLVAEARTREQVTAQARAVLEEVVASLRGCGAPGDAPDGARQGEDRLSETIGVSRASGNVHAIESLRAVAAFSEVALSAVVEDLPPSSTSSSEVAAAALTVQRIFMLRVTRAALAYGGYLLEKVHESHADERRRISRELHDRVAHSIMVVFRSLELYEMYGAGDPSKAREKLELAKGATQEALELTRGLSRELRSTSAEEGLEAALSELLTAGVPRGVRSRVSVRGEETLIAPRVVRDELFLILREGVRNAVAHSEAGTIAVEVDIAESHVRAVVEDDGHGFEPGAEETRTGGTGLASMEERASLLGGTLGLVSTRGEGTRVEVSLPLPGSRP